MTTIALGNSIQPLKTSRTPHFSIYVLNSDKEQLVSEAERQMLEKWWVGISSKPRLDAPLDLIFKMHASHLPTFEEFRRHLLHFYVTHDLYLNQLFQRIAPY